MVYIQFIRQVFLVFCSALLMAEEGKPAKDSQAIFLEDSWICKEGRIAVKFTMINKAEQGVEMIADRLPWSVTEGGAEVLLSTADRSEEYMAQRAPIDFNKKIVLPPGEKSRVLEVEALLPSREAFVKKHGKVFLKWRYVISGDLPSISGKPKAYVTGTIYGFKDLQGCL